MTALEKLLAEFKKMADGISKLASKLKTDSDKLLEKQAEQRVVLSKIRDGAKEITKTMSNLPECPPKASGPDKPLPDNIIVFPTLRDKSLN